MSVMYWDKMYRSFDARLTLNQTNPNGKREEEK